MSDESVTLTRELVNACKTERGGFTNATIAAFGLSWPLARGWPEGLIGRRLPKAAYQEAIDGKFLFRTKRGNIRDVRPALTTPELPPQVAPMPSKQSLSEQILAELKAIRDVLERIKDHQP